MPAGMSVLAKIATRGRRSPVARTTSSSSTPPSQLQRSRYSTCARLGQEIDTQALVALLRRVRRGCRSAYLWLKKRAMLPCCVPSMFTLMQAPEAKNSRMTCNSRHRFMSRWFDERKRHPYHCRQCKSHQQGMPDVLGVIILEPAICL